jgi:hypothetical protein
MRSTPPEPRPVSHFTGWMSSGRPLMLLHRLLFLMNSSTEMLPAVEISVDTSRLNFTGGSSSLSGHTA